MRGLSAWSISPTLSAVRLTRIHGMSDVSPPEQSPYNGSVSAGGSETDPAARVEPPGAPAESPAPPIAGADPFGRLEQVQLRKYWKDEARDFTPWLAKERNLSLLGEAIGMNLEHVATEQYVGPFRADVIAKDEDTEVIIENQLDGTDHKHLGQIMVYAANRGSGVIVWIARQVTDEYRKVIDWLNDKTDVSFFALEVELWRIGDSPVAPKFNVVCEPNNFARAVKDSDRLGAAAQLQLEFWTEFTQYLNDQDVSFTIPRPQGQHWYNLRLGTSLAHIALTALKRENRLGCELYMGHKRASEVYRPLEEARDTIEAELGCPGQLEWMPLPDRQACRIALYKDIDDLSDRDGWPDAFAWLLEWAEKFRQTFGDRVRSLQLPDPEDDAANAVNVGSADAFVAD
jgi:hypothetical protein